MDENFEITPDSLSEAWERYVDLFGEPPHGTKTQLSALLQLARVRESDAGAWETYQHIKKQALKEVERG